MRLDFLDFSSIELRKKACETEVKIKDSGGKKIEEVYLGTIPLIQKKNGDLQLGVGNEESATPVDWLVKMRKLPEEKFLHHMVKNKMLQISVLSDAASLLSNYYKDQKAVFKKPSWHRKRLQRSIDTSLHDFKYWAPELLSDLPEQLSKQLLLFIEQHAKLLDRRKIVEGHGDLRPEHICCDSSGPLVIDRIEFDPELRMVDPVDELAFLSMECTFLGAPQAEALIFEYYSKSNQDRPPKALIDFYKSYRAFLRARFSILHLSDHPQDPHFWLMRAKKYLKAGLHYMSSIKEG